ncbi:MAG: hypothetical protein AAGA96_06650 [Verrucomicrobiota bacterium]
MRARFSVVLTLMVLGSEVWAVPNSFFSNGGINIPIIPAFPRFNADLTEEFLSEENWISSEFSGPWQAEPSLPDLQVSRMTASPVVLGEVPMSVMAYSNEGGVVEIAIHFLDAGLYFGYLQGGEPTREAREAGREKRNEFSRHFKELSKKLTNRLEDGCGRGKIGEFGVSSMLRTEFVDYHWEGFTLRLVQRDDHSVSVHVFERGNEANSFIDRDLLEMSRRERQDWLLQRVSTNEDGVSEVKGLPMFTQGTTPFCSLHSLAMVSSHLGLKARTETLVAAADFKNTGSAGGSDLIEVHRAVAQELGMKVSLAPKFDAARINRSIEDGLPVIVWRRVSAERERVHEEHASVLSKDPDQRIDPLDTAEIETLPQRDLRGSPSHASVVTGVDLERGEVIYTEPWGDSTRGRRMRV